MEKYISTAPNFSIVVPGGCNAKCSFCFWNRQSTNGKKLKYLDSLGKILSGLPEYFKTISITGGEPTASPMLPGILNCIADNRQRFDRVVLSSNGYKLLEHTQQLRGVVDFVNISRHDVEDVVNQAVFNTDTVPGESELERLIFELNQVGIQVTLSKVLMSDTLTNTSTARVDAYIEFAKKIGASGVFFRKQHGDLTPHPLELKYSHLFTRENGCPVCLSRAQIIKGMPVEWKRGLLEPSTQGVHEVVMQPSGMLSFDWAGKLTTTLVGIRSAFHQPKTSKKHKTLQLSALDITNVTNTMPSRIGSCGRVSGCGGGCGK
jgi:organic radical activating enzyme